MDIAFLRCTESGYKVHLEEEIPVNGSCRIYRFAGHLNGTRDTLVNFASNLNERHSFYKSYELEDVSRVNYHEEHNPYSRSVTVCTIFAANRRNVKFSPLPEVFGETQVAMSTRINCRMACRLHMTNSALILGMDRQCSCDLIHMSLVPLAWLMDLVRLVHLASSSSHLQRERHEGPKQMQDC